MALQGIESMFILLFIYFFKWGVLVAAGHSVTLHCCFQAVLQIYQVCECLWPKYLNIKKNVFNLPVRGITDRLSLDFGATEWIDLHAGIITHNSQIVIVIWKNYIL